jgi:hypothetical protein
VATLDDEPRQDDNPGPTMVPTRLAEGERLQTGRAERARLTVDGLGHVEIAPHSRVRLVAAKTATVSAGSPWSAARSMPPSLRPPRPVRGGNARRRTPWIWLRRIR